MAQRPEKPPLALSFIMNKILKIRATGGEGGHSGITAAGQQTRVIAITSGKGGVGKTNITSNLGIALASRGARVCIFDADTSLANINIVMGLTPRYTIEHLLSGEKTIDDIIIDGPKGVKIVPAASGIATCAQLAPEQRRRLIEALTELEERFDYLLIDTAAGIGDTVLSFIQSAQYVVLVISPEPTSLTDAFALLRMLKRRGFKRPIYVLVNMVLNYANSMEVFKRFEAAAKKYLHINVHYLGYIPRDEAVSKAVTKQTPVILQEPSSVASRCFMTLADVLSKQLKAGGHPPRFSDYWKRQTAAEEKTAAAPASQPPPPGTDPETAAQRLLEFLAAPETTANAAQDVLHRLIDAYATRFHGLPCNTSQILRLLMEAPQFNETEFRDLIFSLEGHYEKRFGHPVRSVENRMVKLIDDIGGSQEQCRQLILHLKENYGPQLCREILRSPAEIVRMIREEELDKDTLAFLLEGLNGVYRERYGTLPGSEARAVVAGMHKLVERLDHQETALEDSLLRLSHFIEDSLAEEEGEKKNDDPTPPRST